jgi:hypothetical protein
MSLLQRLLGWVTGDAALLKAAAEEEGTDDVECNYVNLTGHTLHFCHETTTDRYEVYMTLETQGPVPAVRSELDVACCTQRVRAGSIEVYARGQTCRTISIANLREKQSGVTLVVPEDVLDASEHLREYEGRDDLVCIVGIPYTKVDGGIKDDVYCVGVRMQHTYDYSVE